MALAKFTSLIQMLMAFCTLRTRKWFSSSSSPTNHLAQQILKIAATDTSHLTHSFFLQWREYIWFAIGMSVWDTVFSILDVSVVNFVCLALKYSFYY